MIPRWIPVPLIVFYVYFYARIKAWLWIRKIRKNKITPWSFKKPRLDCSLLAIKIKKHTIHKTLSYFGIKATKQGVIEAGFFSLQGMMAAIVLNDIWRLFNLPGENVPVLLDGEPSGQDWDHYLQMAIALAVMSGEYVFHEKHFGAFGAGMLIGTNFANKSEGSHSKQTKNKGTYIGFVQ